MDMTTRAHLVFLDAIEKRQSENLDAVKSGLNEIKSSLSEVNESINSAGGKILTAVSAVKLSFDPPDTSAQTARIVKAIDTLRASLNTKEVQQDFGPHVDRIVAAVENKDRGTKWKISIDRNHSTQLIQGLVMEKVS